MLRYLSSYPEKIAVTVNHLLCFSRNCFISSSGVIKRYIYISNLHFIKLKKKWTVSLKSYGPVCFDDVFFSNIQVAYDWIVWILLHLSHQHWPVGKNTSNQKSCIRLVLLFKFFSHVWLSRSLHNEI